MDTKGISDLGFITGLVTLGYSPRERTREGRRVMFIFDWDENMQALEDDYFNNRMEVDARKFHTTMKSVKQSIYQLEDR
jgi:hypothetical protein